MPPTPFGNFGPKNPCKVLKFECTVSPVIPFEKVLGVIPLEVISHLGFLLNSRIDVECSRPPTPRKLRPGAALLLSRK